MDLLFVDIETICTQRPDVREYIAASVKHPGNISKAETIARWNDESRPAAVDEALAATSLDGSFGQIVCICWAWNDEPVKTSFVSDLSLECEAGVLKAFFADVMMSGCIARVRVVGHNVAAFDLRFIRQRSIVHDLFPPLALPFDAKPWDAHHVYDTMIQWAGVGGRISMDKLCLALGIDGKGGISGADVWPMAQAGRFDDIASYCRGDVERTRAIYKRMTYNHPAEAEQ